MTIYIYGHPPPLDRPRNCISDLSRKRGGGGEEHHSKIPRVSKNPKLGLGFLDFWNFGNSRNFVFFWILSKFLEFPKIRNLGWDFWIFGFLETQVLVRFF